MISSSSSSTAVRPISRAGWRIEEAPVTYLAREGRSKVTGTVLGTVRAVRDMAAVLR